MRHEPAGEPDRGPLRGHGRRRPGARRLRGPPAPLEVRDEVSVKSLGQRTVPAGPSVARSSKARPIPRARPADWPTSAARSVVLEHAGDAPLVERVTFRQIRRQRQIRDAGTRIELSLDEVNVIADGREVGRFRSSKPSCAGGRAAGRTGHRPRCRPRARTGRREQARDGPRRAGRGGARDR